MIELFAALALLVAPATAPTGSNKHAVRTLHKYASCLAASQTKDARNLLAMDYRSAEYAEALRKLALRNHCCAVNRSIQIHGSLLFAGVMAERLYLADFRRRDPAQLVAASGGPVGRDAGEALGLCVVRAAPVHARALLDTVPTSAREDAVVARLMPVAAACTRKGDEVRINRSGTRALLALALYRIAAQAQLSSAGRQSYKSGGAG